MTATYDYIIVGAGSSGCVLAARLSEDPSVKVLLVEAGGSEQRTIVRMPLAWFAAMRTPGLGWGYASEPEPFADNRVIPVPRGKLLGGCSSINGMMYSRGHPKDYDDWAAMGLQGWGHQDVLPWFRISESNWRGAGPDHGASGPITVARHRTDDYIYPNLIAAALAMGYTHLNDFHGEVREGFSAPDFTTHHGRRASPASAFLRPAMSRPNLTVVTHALTTRVTIESGRAVGIGYLHGGQPVETRVQREVILSAGTFNSPQILMLSGVGPADELRGIGIKPAADLPGVGANLQDHASIGLIYQAAGPFTFDRQLRADRFALALLRWQLFGRGSPAGLPVSALGFVRTMDGLDRPDDQILISPVAMDAKVWFPGWRKRRGDVFSIANVLLHPESRGSVTLRSADPAAKPAIRFNLLSTEGDRASFRRFVRFTREFFSQRTARNLIAKEQVPGDSVQSDSDIDAFVRSRVSTAMHATSTCAMGLGPQSVVDERLRVYGIAGLRVVDCSVMPTIVGGNTNAPAIMIAEKAAAMIRQPARSHSLVESSRASVHSG
jgi:choline dehydrogenase